MNYVTNMLRAICVGVMASMLFATMPSAQAATQNWIFQGSLNDSAFSGNFSFDDALLSTAEGFDANTFFAPVSSFAMSYQGTSYSLADVWGGYAEVSFFGDAFVGLATSIDPMTFVAGLNHLGQAYVANDLVSADVIYAPVPEPQSYAMLIAGLGLLAVASRRWVKNS